MQETYQNVDNIHNSIFYTTSDLMGASERNKRWKATTQMCTIRLYIFKSAPISFFTINPHKC